MILFAAMLLTMGEYSKDNYSCELGKKIWNTKQANLKFEKNCRRRTNEINNGRKNQEAEQYDRIH